MLGPGPQHGPTGRGGVQACAPPCPPATSGRRRAGVGGTQRLLPWQNAAARKHGHPRYRRRRGLGGQTNGGLGHKPQNGTWPPPGCRAP
eukprot:3331227-Lingulodinium_polyedra.AAC.1